MLFVKLEFLFKQEGICDFKLAQSITVLMEWKQKRILGIIEWSVVGCAGFVGILLSVLQLD